MITAPVDQGKLTTLRGNVYPLARAEFDRGAAPASLPMDRMMLVLKRSPQQESALDLLLQQQQDRSSPNYHKWLTPQQFGQQFGPSDQDIQTITSWLQSQGFQNVNVSNGRTVIQFSGTAGQVQQAFHTAIHRYVLANGEEHWANSTDPQIPTALTPVVVGIKQLHNFFPKPLHHVAGTFSRGAAGRPNPELTTTSGCESSFTAPCYVVGAYDFATIYNVIPVWNSGVTGTGETIAIVSDSDINETDVTQFRSIFGLPAINFQRIIPPGTVDPGIEDNSENSDESEAVLDVEWSGAVATGATIDLVISADNTSSFSFGGDYSAQYIVDSDIAPILSYSYGECELGLGTSGNSFYNSLWQQAAGEGITVLIATGDNGAAGCDTPNPPSTTNPVAQPAQFGLAVSGEASTPYNIAVGGTDFNDLLSPTTYWNTSNASGTQTSVKGYIPETTYNDSCTNAIFTSAGFPGTPEQNCNSTNSTMIPYISPFGGGGGVSACTTSDGTDVSSCSGGYAKPSWQTGPGVPADGKRDIPDVSLFAGDGSLDVNGLNGSFYLMCELDADSNEPCSEAFGGVGGTSVSTQVFAGIMALLDEVAGGRQGNVNPTLYSIAATQPTASCNANSPATTCVFNDVTSGTISMPCENSPTLSPNCYVTNSSDATGLLSASAGSPLYNAGTGYDQATGLGSVNVANLTGAWSTFGLSSGGTVNITSPGSSNTLQVTVSAKNGFSGTVNLASCSGLPSGATCSFSPTSVTLSGTTTSATSTVTVSTTASSMVGPAIGPRDPGIWKPDQIAAVSGGVFLALLFIFFSSSRRRLSRALATLAFASLIALAACGGGSSNSTPSNAGSGGGTTTSGGTPTGTSTVTINATSGSLTHAMNFTLTIQ